jgi:hypothetical protein
MAESWAVVILLFQTQTTHSLSILKPEDIASSASSTHPAGPGLLPLHQRPPSLRRQRAYDPTVKRPMGTRTNAQYCLVQMRSAFITSSNGVAPHTPPSPATSTTTTTTTTNDDNTSHTHSDGNTQIPFIHVPLFSFLLLSSEYYSRLISFPFVSACQASSHKLPNFPNIKPKRQRTGYTV